MSNKPVPTQADVDGFITASKELWAKALEESGQTQTMFLVSGGATMILAEYENIKEVIEEHGFTVPPLVEGVTVSFPEEDNGS